MNTSTHCLCCSVAQSHRNYPVIHALSEIHRYSFRILLHHHLLDLLMSEKWLTSLLSIVAFRAYDSDGDGFVTPEDIKSFLMVSNWLWCIKLCFVLVSISTCISAHSFNCIIPFANHSSMIHWYISAVVFSHQHGHNSSCCPRHAIRHCTPPFLF